MHRNFIKYNDQELIDNPTDKLPENDLPRINIVIQQRILESLNLILQELQEGENRDKNTTK